MLLPIVYAPDPRLKKISENVTDINDKIRKFIDDLIASMQYEDGAGISAVQVNVHKRIMIIDCENQDTWDENRKSDPIVMINPVITGFSDERVTNAEGCLSFPGLYFEVERAKEVEVEYTDYDGNIKKIGTAGIRAKCVQHEIDHLNGVVFTDHLSKLKQMMMLKKAEKIKKRLKAGNEA